MSGKVRLASIGQQRPYFYGQAKDRKESVMAEAQRRAAVQEREWRDMQKSKFPTFSAVEGEKKSEIGRDFDVKTLVEEIRGLEQGQSSVKRLIKRDLVTLNFCFPRVTPNPQTTDDFVYTAEYKEESQKRLCEHCIRMDGFARFTNDRAKYKSTMR